MDTLCFECNKPAEGGHHVVPKSRGGIKEVPLCGECHAKAHHAAQNMAHATLTREGLQRAKARGVRLGSPKPGRWLNKANGWEAAKAKAVVACQVKAQDAYANILPTVKEKRAAGWTIAEVVVWLNEQGFLTSAKKPFTVSTLWRVLKRYLGAEAARNVKFPSILRRKA